MTGYGLTPRAIVARIMDAQGTITAARRIIRGEHTLEARTAAVDALRAALNDQDELRLNLRHERITR